MSVHTWQGHIMATSTCLQQVYEGMHYQVVFAWTQREKILPLYSILVVITSLYTYKAACFSGFRIPDSRFRHVFKFDFFS